MGILRGADSRDRAEKLLEEALRVQMEGRYSAAAELYHRSLEEFPTAEAHTFLGWTYSFMGRLDDAIEECRKAIEAPRYDPRHFPHFNLARVYIQRYEYKPAIEHLRKALELEPQYGSAQKELQRILTRMN